MQDATQRESLRARRISAASYIARHSNERSASPDFIDDGGLAFVTVTHVPHCLTRVIIDDDAGIEIAQLRRFTERIHQLLPNVSVHEREYIAGALLNLALGSVQRSASSGTRRHRVGSPSV